MTVPLVDVAMGAMVVTLVTLILTGMLAPRRELAALREEADRIPIEPLADYSMITQAQVLEWLPQWMVADFDCPDRGPHDFLPRVTSRGNHYEWCRHCNRMKRTVDEWDDTQHPLDAIYTLQFRR